MKPLSISKRMLIGLMFSLSWYTYAQPTHRFNEQPSILKEKSLILKTVDSTALRVARPNFPSVYTTKYYRDDKILKELGKVEKSGDLVKLDQMLGQYIRRFGIGNFRRSTKLLWIAGRTKQLLGDTANALFYYELAYKHNYGAEIPKLSFDSLNAPTHNEWLSIDKYYELLEVREKIDELVPPKKVQVPMGGMINSDKPDYAPFMHSMDSLLIFTSRRDLVDNIDPFAKPNEDLYFSYKDFMDGSWVLAEKFPESINTQYNEGSACVGPEGKVLLFTRCNDPEGMGDCDIYQATYDEGTGGWKDVKNMGNAINSSYWDSQPNISPDGKWLFFTSNRAGGFGATDIYFSIKTPEGWSKAQNLGPMINSPRQEVTPFFHKINKTLYFSSTGQLKNFGGFDIFKSRWQFNDWEMPNNVGPLINTPGNEYYFSIDGQGKEIFYSRSDGQDLHERQNFDLFSFDMPMEARPDAISSLKGYLVDSVSGHPMVGTIMIIDLDENVEVAPKEINEEGYFEFDLIENRRYRMYVMGENYLTIKNDFVFNGDTTFQVFVESFEQNKPLVFESFEFGSNSYKLRSKIKPKMDYIVTFLELYPMFKIQVEGHTDSDGGAEYNLELSEQRAKQIATYIMRTGSFDQGRVSYIGYGETRPIVPNDTKENKHKNRRVEFKLILNETYDGDLWLPTKDELFFDDELEEDEEFEPDDEFNLDGKEKGKSINELELDDEIDLNKNNRRGK